MCISEFDCCLSVEEEVCVLPKRDWYYFVLTLERLQRYFQQTVGKYQCVRTTHFFIQSINWEVAEQKPDRQVLAVWVDVVEGKRPSKYNITLLHPLAYSLRQNKVCRSQRRQHARVLHVVHHRHSVV